MASTGVLETYFAVTKTSNRLTNPSVYEFTAEIGNTVFHNKQHDNLELALIAVDFRNLQVSANGIYHITTSLINSYQVGDARYPSIARISLNTSSPATLAARVDELRAEITKQAGTITLGQSPTSITLPATTNFDPVSIEYGPR